jgi:cellulose synthase (UDP-forming)
MSENRTIARRLNERFEELVIGGIALLITVISYVVFGYQQLFRVAERVMDRDLSGVLQVLTLTVVIFGFGYAIIVYHICRTAYFVNLGEVLNAEASESELRSPFLGEAPEVAILIPSYCEETHVIWQTMMSAVLVDYPQKRIVLLLDNSPTASDQHKLTAEARAQPGLIFALFAAIADRFRTKAGDLRGGLAQSRLSTEQILDGISALNDEAAEFLESIAVAVTAGRHGGTDNHVRRFFVDTILLQRARALRDGAKSMGKKPCDFQDIEAELQRLSTLFEFDIDIFERKRFLNLSQAPNKAANLNSYLSLMGNAYRVESDGRRQWLVQTAYGDSSFAIRDAEFVVVLDADSFMHPDYLTRTIAAMLKPGNEKVAVAQTPYKAIPGSPSMLERVAGASTDVHYCVAEGLSVLHAGSWVGATALVRKAALKDIVYYSEERGFQIAQFIPDTTLIEDADATVRFAQRGWRVLHLPRHLNWSSTPSDFGAMVIQRRRWANGGLIILPRLIEWWRAAPRSFATHLEFFLRGQNLLAAPITAIGGLLILTFPFEPSLLSPWVSLALVPYLYLHGRDLKRLGYGWVDLFRIFAFNVLLLPVVAGGVVNSIEQLWLRRKIPFARTPKIDHRTAVPALYLLAPVALATLSVAYLYKYVLADERGPAFPALWASIALCYSILYFVGVMELVVDLFWAARLKALTMFAWSFRKIEDAIHMPGGAERESGRSNYAPSNRALVAPVGKSPQGTAHQSDKSPIDRREG